MAIPPFTNFGLLPEGRHTASAADIASRYLSNPNRLEIWQKFEQFCADIKQQPWFLSPCTIWLDGGFVSNKPHTKDLDAVLDISLLDNAACWEAHVWVESRRTHHYHELQLDLYLYHPNFPNDVRAFFAYVKKEDCATLGMPIDTLKGVLSFTL